MINKKIPSVLGLGIILIITGFFGYVFLMGNKNTNMEQKEVTIIENNNQETQEYSIREIDTSDWQTYRNEEYGVTFSFPENLDWRPYGPIPASQLSEYKLNTTKHFSLFSPNEEQELCSEIEVEIGNFTFKGNVANFDDYCDPEKDETLNGCVNKFLEAKKGNTFSKIISDYSINNISFKNRIIEATREVPGYYYKHVFMYVNGTFLEFAILGLNGPDKCLDASSVMDSIIKSVNVLN